MTKNAWPELEAALFEMIDKIERIVVEGGYQGDPIEMYLAGGMAVNFYCGSRYTEDVDASFSRRILLSQDDLVVNYTKADGTTSYIYFDKNYNTSFALIHEDFEKDSVDWIRKDVNEKKIRLKVFSPVDLAVSKIARFSERDQSDIMELAAHDLFTHQQLRERAMEALSYFVGNVLSVKNSIDIICRRIEAETLPDRHIPPKNEP